MLITARSSTTTQHPYSLNLLWSIKAIHNTVAAVRCIEHHFLTLYACAHEVSFPNQRPRSLVWELDQYTSEIASQGSTHGWCGLLSLKDWPRLMNTTQVRHCIQLPTCSYTNKTLLTALVNFKARLVSCQYSFVLKLISHHVIKLNIRKLVSQSLIRRVVGPSSWHYYT